MSDLKIPWYEIKEVEAQRPEPGNPGGSEAVFRCIVWDDLARPLQILGVAEHADREIVQQWVNDIHPEAKSLASLDEERS